MGHGKLPDRRGSDGAGSDASGPAVADRDLAVLDDHRDVAPLAGVDEHLLEVGRGLLDVAVVDGVPLAGIGLTGRQRVGSGVLAVDEDGAGRAHGCQYTRAGVAPVIRSAAVADLDLLVRMHEEFSLEDRQAFDAAAARAALDALLREPRFGRAWVIENDDRAAGYLAVCFGYSIEFRGRDAFVDELYVRPPQRGRGLGREALNVAEVACRDAGIVALHLEVRRGNQAARQLYRSAGFSERESYLMTKKLR